LVEIVSKIDTESDVAVKKTAALVMLNRGEIQGDLVIITAREI
jgi:hypothetical protein